MGNVSLGHTDDAPPAYNVVIKGHNSRSVKVILPKFELDLSFVVISIVYMFHNIWLRQTKVENRNEKFSNISICKGA